MTTVQHALVVGTSAPYSIMLRYVDAVPEAVAMPAQAGATIALGTVTSSPDGRLWLAAGTASSLTPFRLWRMDDSYNINAVAVDAALPLAGTIVDLKFITNTHVVAVDSVNGVWFGVFNRDTNVITWTRLNTLAAFVGVENLSDTQFIISRGPGTSPYSQVYGISGDTATLETWTGLTANPYSDRAAFHRASKLIFGPRSNTNTASAAAQALWVDVPNKTMVNNGTYIDFPTSEIGRIASGSNGGTVLCAKFSPSGRHVACGLNVAPYLRFVTQVSGRRYPNTLHKLVVAAEGALDDDKPIAAAVNDVEFVGNDMLLVAVNSRFGGTGRVKGYFHSDGDEKLVEDNRIRTIFNGWDSVAMNITSGPLETVGATSGFYDTALPSLINRTADLTNLKIVLVSSAAVFNPDHTTLAQAVGGTEVFGSSWPQGGIECDDATFETFGTDGQVAYKVSVPNRDLNDAGTFTFRAAILYDNTDANKKPMMFFDFGANQVVKQFDRLVFSFAGGRALVFERG